MRDFIVLRDLANVVLEAPFASRFRAGISLLRRDPPLPQIDVVRGLTPRQVREVAAEPEVVAIAPSIRTALIRPTAAPTLVKPTPGMAWGVAAVGADGSARSRAGVTVAVLDTGIDRTHPAFAGVALVEQDFTGSGNGDRQGHGTHCAGTIFGRDVAGQRIGVARGVTRALIGKVLDDDGSGRSEWLIDGLYWANQQKAQVISMSIGFDFQRMVDDLIAQNVPRQAAMSAALLGYRDNLRVFDEMMDMFRARAAFGADTVVVAASGNESDRYSAPGYEVGTSLPAAAFGVIGVGAVERTGGALRVAGFSNTFPQIVGPGVDILSAWPDNRMAVLQGTSMACPHVAGVAALWWEELAARNEAPLSAQRVASRLLATARTEGFAADMDQADRGAGLVAAP